MQPSHMQTLRIPAGGVTYVALAAFGTRLRKLVAAGAFLTSQTKNKLM